MWNECSVSARIVLKRSELQRIVVLFFFQHIHAKEKLPTEAVVQALKVMPQRSSHTPGR